MIHVICGMIGSGKSTYAKQNYEHVLEYEDYGEKRLQLREAKRLHDQGGLVAYITCAPTREESIFFARLEKQEPGSIEYFWIDTDFDQCIKNIKARNRKSDYSVIQARYKPNQEILCRLLSGGSRYKKITVF